jgi:CRP/FNR family transcriptional regulator, cyclic AMP receptor protein
MATTPGADALRQVPLFAGLQDADLASLAAGLDQAEFAANARIFAIGDANASLHLIRSGKVKVVLPGDDQEVILAIMGDGDFFGELSLCDGKPRSASVVALEPTSTYVLPRETFLQFVAAHPPAAIQIMSALASRLRENSERLSENVFLDLPARLAKRLMQLASVSGRETAAGLEITRSLTADELAALVGATVAQVEREMRVLDEGGIVRWDGSTVTIRSQNLLTERVRTGRPEALLGHVSVPRWLLEP